MKEYWTVDRAGDKQNQFEWFFFRLNEKLFAINFPSTSVSAIQLKIVK